MSNNGINWQLEQQQMITSPAPMATSYALPDNKGFVYKPKYAQHHMYGYAAPPHQYMGPQMAVTPNRGFVPQTHPKPFYPASRMQVQGTTLDPALLPYTIPQYAPVSYPQVEFPESTQVMGPLQTDQAGSHGNVPSKLHSSLPGEGGATKPQSPQDDPRVELQRKSGESLFVCSPKSHLGIQR